VGYLKVVNRGTYYSSANYLSNEPFNTQLQTDAPPTLTFNTAFIFFTQTALMFHMTLKTENQLFCNTITYALHGAGAFFRRKTVFS
jgi:hypothetical protein